ncbi:AlkA N-terminal domain-containing protein [Methylobacterium fujisawaense]|uniref:AlkA N-terminal domain-containing protein n=1 Tax=Methylobacterium fujisawaense TaxID=107400 RepID=UPI002F3520EE
MIERRLPVRPPYDWPAIRAFLAKRAIPGVETTDPAASYARTISVAGRHGLLTVAPGADCLHATWTSSGASAFRTARVRPTIVSPR